MKLSDSLICPICGSGLSLDAKASGFVCAQDESHEFPMVSGVPVLINEENSVFRFTDFVQLETDTIAQGMFDRRSGTAQLPAYRRAYRQFALWLREFHVNLDQFKVTDAISVVETEIEHARILARIIHSPRIV